MKKGKVVSLMHHIPASSPFKSYADLRKYWKNNYGYRLPENGEGIVYINIYFPAIPHTIFTYPEFCIRKIEPRPVPRVDSTPVLQAFLTDIKKKMPHMCQTPLEVTRKPQYTAVTMNSAKGYIESKGHSSMTLIDRKYNVPQRIPARILVTVSENRGQPFNAQPQVSPYRPLTGQPANIKCISGYVLKMPETMSPVIPALPPSQFGYPHDGTLSQDGRQNACKESSPQCPLPYGSNTKVTPSRHQHNHQSPRQSPYAAISNHSMSVQGSPSHQGLFCTPTHPYTSPANSGIYHLSQNVTPVTRMVAPGKKEPQSAPKSARNLNHTIFSLAAELRNQSEQDTNSSPHHACMPAYRKEGGKRFGAAGQSRNLPPPLLQQMPKLPQNVENIQSGIVPRFLRREESEVAHPPAAPRPLVPIFNPKPSRSSLLDNASRYQTPQGPKIKPSFTPHKLRSVTPSAFLSRASTTPTHKPLTNLSTIDLIPCEDIIPPTQHVPKQQPFPSSSTSSHQPAARQALHFGPSNTSSSKEMSTPNHPLLTASSNKHAKKRKAKDYEDAVDAKKSKPRTKPKVQENINVQLMAQNDQLSKVNSITLVAWLKEKGINVSSKDKKTDLMTKVMSFINCTAKET
ncbi:uncharacterized protein LOC129254234 [Lytechinus pictus]|uniref:uncharacterized protein LOC129254234 n=1 Tax=Lytechinus pictus TaxID=7653 RepID=UPI0030B9F488